MVFWDWKSGRIKSRLRCHSKVVIAHEWLPHETSKVVTASWDGLIKLWVSAQYSSQVVLVLIFLQFLGLMLLYCVFDSDVLENSYPHTEHNLQSCHRSSIRSELAVSALVLSM